MGLASAIASRGMSQRIKLAEKAIKQGFFNERALLKIAEKKGKIKYGGSHTEFEWYIRNVKAGQTATFGNPDGELSVLTFEEQQPANRVHLPYCYLMKTYGISDRSIEANKNASDNKIYDIIAENLTLAQIFMYDALGPALYNGTSSDTEQPVGLLGACGSPIHTSAHAVVAALASYAGRTLTTNGFTGSAISSSTTGLGIQRTATLAAAGTSWDDNQWAPVVGSVEDILTTGGSALTAWSTGGIQALSIMADLMSLTRTVSGTGTQIKPDTALMAQGPFSALKNLAILGQYNVRGINLGREDLVFANFPNFVVDTLTCIKDTDVPASADGTERVIVLDSNEFYVETTHTKSEGLIKTDFDPNIAIINGAVGTLKANLAYRVSSPTAVGCIVGCGD
ncbi:MAG: hypothetical protein WC356_01935 [Candidatus Micrarchaeia archaeon]|jgi:hypothetical protein